MSPLVVLLLAALAAPSATVVTGECDVEALDGDAVPAADAELVDVDAIVPCAMAENGFMGPACADAPMYVVTPAGVVLCRLSFAVVASASASTQLSARPTAPLAPTSWGSTPDALLTSLPALPPPVVDDAPRCGERPSRSPDDVDEDAPFCPS